MVFQIFKKKNIINKLHIISTVHVICFIIFDHSYQKKKFLTNFTGLFLVVCYLECNVPSQYLTGKKKNIPPKSFLIPCRKSQFLSGKKLLFFLSRILWNFFPINYRLFLHGIKNDFAGIFFLPVNY